MTLGHNIHVHLLEIPHRENARLPFMGDSITFYVRECLLDIDLASLLNRKSFAKKLTRRLSCRYYDRLLWCRRNMAFSCIHWTFTYAFGLINQRFLVHGVLILCPLFWRWEKYSFFWESKFGWLHVDDWVPLVHVSSNRLLLICELI